MDCKEEFHKANVAWKAGSDRKFLRAFRYVFVHHVGICIFYWQTNKRIHVWVRWNREVMCNAYLF